MTVNPARVERVLTASEGIHCLLAAEDGLWIGTSGGLVWFDPDSGARAKWTTGEGLPAHPPLHVARHGTRLAVATPNGVAWTDDVAALVRDAGDGPVSRTRFEHRALTNPRGDGAYINGLAFVDGRIHAATGGGRLYLEGPGGFELLELPLRQARLLRVLPLQAATGCRRLVLVTNNNGVLLLATGGCDEPSLFQWSEDEGLCSRYVTAAVHAGDFVVIGVHGCIHIARARDLVESPDTVGDWGRIDWSNLSGPAEHTRVHALCALGDTLYAGTSAGLYRIDLADLERAGSDSVIATRVDDNVVRHLAARGTTLWAVQHTDLGRYGDGNTHKPQATLRPRVVSFGTRMRFHPDARWRGGGLEPDCRSVTCLARTPEGLGLGGEGSRVAVQRGERWVTECLSRNRRAPDVVSLVHDPESGSLWASTRHGVFQRDPRGRWHRDLALPGRAMHRLVVWNDRLVAYGSGGVHVRVQGAWSPVELPPGAPTFQAAAAGDAGLALAARPGSAFHLWAPEDLGPQPWPVPIGRANCMAWADDGALWLGTDRGLHRWDGRELRHFAWGREREDHIASIQIDAGYLWVGSQCGVWTAPAVDVLALADGAELEPCGRRFGLLDGLPHGEVTALLADARAVFVGTRGGLAVLRPA